MLGSLEKEVLHILFMRIKSDTLNFKVVSFFQGSECVLVFGARRNRFLFVPL